MADITLTDASGGRITVADDEQADFWEARGYSREKTSSSSKSSSKKSSK